MNVALFVLIARRKIINFFKDCRANCEQAAIEFSAKEAFAKSALSSLLSQGVIKESKIKGFYYLDELKLAEMYKRERVVIWATVGVFLMWGGVLVLTIAIIRLLKQT